MEFHIEPSAFYGEIPVPPSKSHTIRAVFISALADGTSVINNPLVSADGLSALEAVSSMGAEVERKENQWVITGNAGRISVPAGPVDVGNSGTTARFALSMSALGFAPIIITGDRQTRARPMRPLLDSLKNLGARVSDTKGKLPAIVEGPIDGGEAQVDGATSQYLSSLLIHAPIAPKDTTLTVDNLNEKPYVDMTLRWLDETGIEYSRDGYKRFEIKGRQKYRPFTKTIPGDFSSATFFACMGAIPGCKVTLTGLDMDDPQGDKAIFDYLRKMGAKVDIKKDQVTVTGHKLNGVELDLNSTPDALPALAALAALADGATALVNTPQARIKETDRIAVMAEELGKMGIRCEEKPDGLIVHGGKPKSAALSGHADHRIVMSLAITSAGATGPCQIDTAEAVNVTFPNFGELYNTTCGKLAIIDKP